MEFILIIIHITWLTKLRTASDLGNLYLTVTSIHTYTGAIFSNHLTEITTKTFIRASCVGTTIFTKLRHVVAFIDICRSENLTTPFYTFY